MTLFVPGASILQATLKSFDNILHFHFSVYIYNKTEVILFTDSLGFFHYYQRIYYWAIYTFARGIILSSSTKTLSPEFTGIETAGFFIFRHFGVTETFLMFFPS